jgi:chromosome segregation protein
MPDIYGLILETLRRHLGTRAEAVLEEGLKRLGKRQEELSPKDGETLLKGLAFRELQARLPAKEAKRVVEEALKKLSAPSEPVDLEALEAGLKRFGLYLDWPEVARYRALVNRLRQDPDPRLMREAKALLEALEEKLEEALLRQAKDLAHLEESLERVRHLGGPKVRRLEKLVETVREAQKEGLLAQAEVERARSLALELRKLLESSVARPPTLPEIVFETQEEPPEDVFLTVEEAEELEGELIVDLEALPEEAARRLEALEVEEEGRRLEELLARHAHLLQEPTVSPLLAEVQALLEAGKPAGEKLSLLEAALKEAEANLRAEKKARLIQLEARLRSPPPARGGQGLPRGRLRPGRGDLEGRGPARPQAPGGGAGPPRGGGQAPRGGEGGSWRRKGRPWPGSWPRRARPSRPFWRSSGPCPWRPSPSASPRSRPATPPSS